MNNAFILAIEIFILFAIFCTSIADIPVPPKPNLSNPTSTTIDVIPINAQKIEEFNIHVFLRGLLVVSKDIQASALVFTIQGLRPNTMYTANIVSCNAFKDCSARSEFSSFRTRPTGPSNPLVRAATNSSLEVVARDSQFTTGHFELTAVAPELPPMTINCLRTAQSCVITGLSSNRVYQVTTRICPGPPSICSDPSPPTESRTAIGEMHSLLIKKEHENNITVSWEIPDTVQKTTVQLTQMNTCIGFTSSCLVETSSIDKYECTFTDLPSNAEFKFAVVGCAADVGGVASICTPTAYATGFTLPAAPRQVYVSKITSSTAKVEWLAPLGNHQNIATFRVRARTADSSEVVSCEYNRPGKCGSFCHLYGLRGGLEYTAHVEACMIIKRTNRTVCGAKSFDSYFRTAGTFLDVAQICMILFTVLLMLIPFTLASVYGLQVNKG